MNGIDIKLVKEQLRLLGHTVDDAVILAFVQGLGAGSAAVHHAAESENETDGSSTIEGSDSSKSAADSGDDAQHSQDKSMSPNQQQNGKAAYVPSTALFRADPTSNLQSPLAGVLLSDASPSRSQLDQHASSSQDEQYSSPMIHGTLDQRCRKFLARLLERPSSQQLLQQYQVHASREHCPQKCEVASLEPLSGTEADSEYSNDDDDDPKCLQMPSDLLRSCRISNSACPPVNNGHSQSTVHSQAAIADCRLSSGLATGRSSNSAEAEDLMQLSHQRQQTAMQLKKQQSQQQSQPCLVTPGVGALVKQAKSSTATPRSSLSVLDEASQVVYEAPAGPAEQALPRFGFRQGYRPIGVHIPPLPAFETQHVITQTRSHAILQPADAHAKQELSPVASLASLQSHPAPWLDVRPCSDSIIGEALLGGTDTHYSMHRIKHTPRSGSSNGDPLFHIPTSPTSPVSVTATNKHRSPAKVIAQTAAASAQDGRAACRQGKAQSLAGLMSAASSTSGSIRTSSKCSSSRVFGRHTSYSIDTAGNICRPSSSSGLSCKALYSQQLSLSGPRRRSTAVAPGVQKTDRVARFQQMQQQWQKDRFLSSSAGSSSVRPSSSNR